MLTVRDIMTPEVQALEPDMTLRQAVERLAADGYRGAPVVQGGRLVGVVSSSDLLEFESTNPGVPAHRDERQEWGDWGSPQLWEEDFTEPPSGYFRDMWADSGAELVERMSESASPEWDFLAEHVVGEVMTRQVITVAPEAPVVEAARVMIRSGVHRILVTERDALVGILSAMDLVRAVAEGKLGEG